MKIQDSKTMLSPSVVCFGEVLWDVFPDGEKAGGAPFNVAYNLKQQGVNSNIVSRVGKDALGARLLRQVEDWNMATAYCQVDEIHATGTVLATIDEHNEAHYDIVSPVAWDYILPTAENTSLVASAAAFVYGSLAARNSTSCKTLFQLLEVAQYKIFDINLRPPFYTIDLLQQLMAKADVVKTNEAELKLIVELLGLQYESEAAAVQLLQERFGVAEFLITKGGRGSCYYSNTEHLEFPSIPITIKDTVGSGDSFLSGFLAKRVIGDSVHAAMQNALAMGAFITSKKGACPPYTLAEFTQFKEHHLGRQEG